MNNKLTRATLLVVAAFSLTACSIGYRCPLDPNEKPDSPTACSGMRDAMAGSRLGTGGNTSVLVDDKGRLVPKEMLGNHAAKPLMAAKSGADEPYAAPSGAPAFQQPKVFQVWASAFVDAQGNLHDGHHAWFATPGQWKYGTLNNPGAVGESAMRPALPTELPDGKIVDDPRKRAQVTTAVRQQAQVQQAATPGQQDKDKMALQNLSNAAGSMAKKPAPNQAQPSVPGNTNPYAPATTAQVPQSAAGVTAPVIQLAE